MLLPSDKKEPYKISQKIKSVFGNNKSIASYIFSKKNYKSHWLSIMISWWTNGFWNWCLNAEILKNGFTFTFHYTQNVFDEGSHWKLMIITSVVQESMSEQIRVLRPVVIIFCQAKKRKLLCRFIFLISNTKIWNILHTIGRGNLENWHWIPNCAIILVLVHEQPASVAQMAFSI